MRLLKMVVLAVCLLGYTITIYAKQATILVTGCAGFVGHAVSKRLLSEGQRVIGIDNLNNYYDISLKKDRLKQLSAQERFVFYPIDLSDREKTFAFLNQHSDINYIIHLAAQAGVRYSLQVPMAYIDSNLLGFAHILEGAKQLKIKHLIYASSSSVYGNNSKVPFSENDKTDNPLSLYAATKKANELMAHVYSHLYQLPTTGLRFFTVYGPWGRPDMAYFKFTKSILEDKTIEVYNHGHHRRDFTYIDDIVDAILLLLEKPNKTTYAAVYNIGHHRPVELMDFIHIIEKEVGKKAKIKFLPAQPGDVEQTYASLDELTKIISYKPKVPIEEGIKRFVAWYVDYYKEDLNEKNIF